MLTMRACKCLIAFLTVCANLPAQSGGPDPLQIGSITVSGSIHERYEDWDFFRAKGENSYGYSGSLLRLMLSQNEQSYDWGFELAAPILLGIPNHAVQPAPLGQLGLGASYYAANHNDQNAASVFVKQAFLHLKGVHSNVRFGRFEFTDGGEVTPTDETLAIVKRDGISQRLIGTFGFSDVQRSFDGAQYNYTDGSWNFTAFSAVPDRGVFQVDGWGWVKTPVTYAALTKQASFGSSKAEWRVLGIYYNDDRSVIKTDNRSARRFRAKDLGGIDDRHFWRRLHPGDSHLLHGTFDLDGVGCIADRTLLGFAHANARAPAPGRRVGFQPKIAKPVRPRLRGGYFYSDRRQQSQRQHSRHLLRHPAHAFRVYASAFRSSTR